MSAAEVRRRDKLMPESEALELLRRGYCGCVATTGPDGWPYVIPLLYVFLEDRIWLHNTRASGHLRRNVARDPRACFEVDDAGPVFAYGRFECDTTLAYASVVAFCHVRVMEERAQKTAFFDAFMAKYSNAALGRAKGFYPRLDEVNVYALSVERLSGKHTPLPAVESRWPASDRTKTPKAVPPR
jgi:nitroimidazol reductase NimA-like FMN-containing flavoprotein (pyridoxamine 5'-phosphate oxidase superfamily)